MHNHRISIHKILNKNSIYFNHLFLTLSGKYQTDVIYIYFFRNLWYNINLRKEYAYENH